MRKSLLIAFGAVATVASAANLKPIQAVAPEAAIEAQALAKVENVVKAPATRATVDDAAGTYTWYFKMGLNGALPESGTVTVTKASDTQVYVKFAENDSTYFTVGGTFDEAKGVISLPKDTLNKTATAGYYQVFTQYDWSGSSPVSIDDPIELTVKGQVLQAKPGLVFGLGAVAVADGSAAGYYHLSFNNFFYGNIDWEEVATGVSFTDNFFSPMFGKADTPNTVTVSCGKENPEILKVTGFMSAVSTAAKPLLIDATNPDRVYVPCQSSGITATGRGMTWVASMSALTLSPTSTLQSTVNGVTSSTNITYSEADGKAKVNMPAYSARFAWITYNPGSWYYSGSTKDTVLEYALPASGVTDIVVEDANAPVEYYNLQGVKIAQPAQGTIVIRRQGSNVSKILVK